MTYWRLLCWTKNNLNSAFAEQTWALLLFLKQNILRGLVAEQCLFKYKIYIYFKLPATVN